MISGDKTCSVFEGQKLRLRAVQECYLRRACEVTWRERWSSERGRRQCDEELDVTGSSARNVWPGYHGKNREWTDDQKSTQEPWKTKNVMEG